MLEKIDSLKIILFQKRQNEHEPIYAWFFFLKCMYISDN